MFVVCRQCVHSTSRDIARHPASQMKRICSRYGLEVVEPTEPTEVSVEVKAQTSSQKSYQAKYRRSA